jgi:nitrogen fixation protein FixH
MQGIPDKKPRSLWPYGIIASFLALAAYDAGIVTLALKTSIAEVDVNPYEEGMHYQEVIDAQRMALKKGVSLATEVNAGRLRVSVLGLPAANDGRATIELLRPDGTTPDIHAEAKLENTSIVYDAPPELKRGLWMITVDAYEGATRYRLGPDKIVLE